VALKAIFISPRLENTDDNYHISITSSSITTYVKLSAMNRFRKICRIKFGLPLPCRQESRLIPLF